MRVKTERYNLFVLERELRDAVRRLEGVLDGARPSDYVRAWFAPQAARELLAFRELITEYEHGNVLRVVLARAARSARRTTHFDLDFPRAPQREPYWCHKHRRTCRPMESAAHFLRRYTLDTLERIKAFSRVRAPRRTAEIVHGDARTLALGGPYDGVVTSRPTRPSSTTTSSIATRTSCSASTTDGSSSSARRRAGRAGQLWRPTRTGSRPCSRTSGRRCGRERRS